MAAHYSAGQRENTHSGWLNSIRSRMPAGTLLADWLGLTQRGYAHWERNPVALRVVGQRTATDARAPRTGPATATPLRADQAVATPAASVGQRIARIRRERGYTQNELAERIGTIQALVSDYERDKLRLNAEMGCEVCHRFGSLYR